MKTEQYVFRRQFIFGPKKVTSFPDWNIEEVPGGYYLAVHPDLNYATVKSEKATVILLGYLIDPRRPSLSTSEILKGIISRCNSLNDLFENLSGTCGRFAVIARIKNSFAFFSDTSGLRQVFYCSDSAGRLWCASQPSVLAELFSFRTNSVVERELFGLPLFVSSEYWYPGSLTAYREVSHLNPNHYLDINAKKQVRYWPVRELEEVSLNDGIERASELLAGIMKGASKSFHSALAISSGLDSRLLLAASREVSASIEYLTHTHKALNVSGADIVLPSIMLPRLGLRHNVVFHSEKMDPDFERIFRRNVTTARIIKGKNAYAYHRFFEEHGKHFVVINGNGGEITRNFYYLPKPISTSGFSLASLVGMSSSPLAVAQFGEWLSGAQGVEQYGVSVLDLFYWEQRVGNWAAMSLSEYDIAFESFAPFNCQGAFGGYAGSEAGLSGSSLFCLFTGK